MLPAHSPQSKWPNVAVLGAGAVGSYFGGLLARAGIPVTLIGRNPHIEKIASAGLFLDSIHFQETIPMAASTSIEAAKDAEIVLLCVKSYDTSEAVNSIADRLSRDTIIVSLQNGVENAERVHAAGMQVVAAAVYVAAELSAPGHVKHTGAGNLAIGDFWDKGRIDHLPSDAVKKVADLFSQAGVPCRISENIQSDLWTKLVMNCSYNAISALCSAKYGLLAKNLGIQETIRQVIAEIVAVAHALRIEIPSADALMQSAIDLGARIADAFSSTAQDIHRGRRTEIDSLNGYIARRGRELGIATPVNQTLHSLMKLLEQKVTR
ncbi:MAG TPA: 2-dehydropantoate 2-reductase [Candidatus Angelobacter sp.]|jgi:2-dehydropantoate 2-reductase